MDKGDENVVILNPRRGQIKETSVKRNVPENVLHSFIQLQVHIFKLLIPTYHPPITEPTLGSGSVQEASE